MIDGQDGLLVEPRRPDQLAVAIERMLDDEPLRLRLIEAGLKRASSFNVEAFGEEFAEEVRLARAMA